MKCILLFMSLVVLVISCESKTEAVVAPTYYPEGWGENINVPASFGFQDVLDFLNTTDSLSKLKKHLWHKCEFLRLWKQLGISVCKWKF